MKKILTQAAVALMVGGALLTAIPADADARSRGGYSGSRGHGHGGYRGGWSGRGRDYVRHGRHRGYRGGYAYRRGGIYRPFYGFARHRGYGGYYGYGYPAYYGYGYYGGDAALAIGAGLLGVAIGSAIASDRGDRYYEDERYYEDDSYYQYHEPPPHQLRTCPDGSPVSAEGYCPPQRQEPPPPPNSYLPERG